jgi:ElaB/YqjD/DUF883 family membrane-anchored ribosome-binding protein
MASSSFDISDTMNAISNNDIREKHEGVVEEIRKQIDRQGNKHQQVLNDIKNKHQQVLNDIKNKHQQMVNDITKQNQQAINILHRIAETYGGKRVDAQLSVKINDITLKEETSEADLLEMLHRVIEDRKQYGGNDGQAEAVE